MSAFSRILQSATCELFTAMRSRRAIAIIVLFCAASLLSVNAAISMLAGIERELASSLGLQPTDGAGVISTALWKSTAFQRMVRTGIDNALVFDDLLGRHPAELIHAWFSFLLTPMLVVLACSNRVADDLHSGAVRFMITRVTRLEWSLGKFFGQALLILIGLLLGALGADVVMSIRLSGSDALTILPTLLIWSCKAWVYSLAWLGVTLGVSHLTHSGAKATMFAVLALLVFSVVPHILDHYSRTPDGGLGLLAHFRVLFPNTFEDNLWRNAFVPVMTGSIWLIAQGFLYLLVGHVAFARRDAR